MAAQPPSSLNLPRGNSSASLAFFPPLGGPGRRQQPPRWRLTWGLPAGIPSLSIALSRVYLGVHWPVCAASLWLNQRRQRRAARVQPQAGSGDGSGEAGRGHDVRRPVRGKVAPRPGGAQRRGDRQASPVRAPARRLLAAGEDA
ncbi:hypothetical protein ACV35H_32615, partial [Pseudomonas aeruginosa]